MNNSEILIYQNSEGNIKIDVRLEEESVWLNQTQMSELFGKGRSTINENINKVYDENELNKTLTLLKLGISEFQQQARIARIARIARNFPALFAFHT